MTHCAAEPSLSRLPKHAFVLRARFSYFAVLILGVLVGGCATIDPRELTACTSYIFEGFRPVAQERTKRFLGKVENDTARCRGGAKAVDHRSLPWVDWQNYWATGDDKSRAYGILGPLGRLAPNGRGIDGALLDLEYQRMEMIKFNLFDNTGTYKEYITGRKKDNQATEYGPTLKTWDSMQLMKEKQHKEYSWEKEEWIDAYEAVGGDKKPQTCPVEWKRFRTLTGICNDIKNPLMGSTGQPFARNVEFESTFPDDLKLDSSDSEKRKVVRNRHGNRLDTLKPDPQVVSRKLFTRVQSKPEECKEGSGLYCDYEPAPFFNVLAAFWIQFMTHDWFSHLYEGDNSPEQMAMGCTTHLVNGIETPLSPDDGGKLGCRPDDRIDKASLAEANDPPTFTANGKKYLSRAYKTTRNNVTAWWDASQIYGYDKNSSSRVKRELISDPQDSTKKKFGAKLRINEGYLPLFEAGDPINLVWAGQEATAFPDNWSIGLSFFHNVFAREHNRFVDEFRKQNPDADSGLRIPGKGEQVILYKEISDDDLFEIARLVVSAEIAKIHTTEWTTQLLYDEPLYLGMNANWHGLGREYDAALDASEKVVRTNTKSDDPSMANQLSSAFTARSGIFGLGNRKEVCWLKWFFCKDTWKLEDDDINGGVDHFGSPFNFPEEFVTVYRLHPMVPDLIEYRELGKDNESNVIKQKIPVVATFRGEATKWMKEKGLANWGLSMGRQPLGRLTLQNHPRFLQNLPMDRFHTQTDKIDVVALDLIRDRERGVPRFNEFRRQYGLRTLKSFDDFIDDRLEESAKHDPAKQRELERQRKIVASLKEVYGWHVCQKFRIVDGKKEPNKITNAQVNEDGTPIDDCLGWPDGTKVDNIEDLDTVVGWLAEPVRPHGFAISETQFQVFILNASRRLFSDRFFTSSFRHEFYTHFGVDWVTNNGPGEKQMEPHKSNGHKVEVSPLKRVLQRSIPELRPELDHVVNVFDPWARDRGEYYNLQWKPQERATSDEAFKKAVQN